MVNNRTDFNLSYKVDSAYFRFNKIFETSTVYFLMTNYLITLNRRPYVCPVSQFYLRPRPSSEQDTHY